MQRVVGRGPPSVAAPRLHLRRPSPRFRRQEQHMAEFKIGVSGCGGRMGRMVALELLETKGTRLAGGIDAADSPYLGRDLGEMACVGSLGIKASSDALGLFRVAD